MIKIELCGYELEIDSEATKKTYKNIPIGGCEECGCNYCKNFSMALSTTSVFPEDITEFFTLAGIDVKKDTEVFQFTEEPSGEHLYGGEYHLWGKVIKHPKVDATIGKHFTFSFSERSPLAQNEFNKNGALCFAFSAMIPWLIKE